MLGLNFFAALKRLCNVPWEDVEERNCGSVAILALLGCRRVIGCLNIHPADSLVEFLEAGAFVGIFKKAVTHDSGQLLRTA